MSSLSPMSQLSTLCLQLTDILSSPRNGAGKKYLCNGTHRIVILSKETLPSGKNLRKIHLLTITNWAVQWLYSAALDEKISQSQFIKCAHAISDALKTLSAERFAKKAACKTLRKILTIALCIIIIGIPIFLYMRRQDANFTRDHNFINAYAGMLKELTSKEDLTETKVEEKKEEEAAKLILGRLRDPILRQPVIVTTGGLFRTSTGNTLTIAPGNYDPEIDGETFSVRDRRNIQHRVPFPSDGRTLIMPSQFIRDLEGISQWKFTFKDDNTQFLFSPKKSHQISARIIELLQNLSTKLGGQNPNDVRGNIILNNLACLHEQGSLKEMTESLRPLGHPCGNITYVSIKIEKGKLYSRMLTLFRIRSESSPTENNYFIVKILARVIPVEILALNEEGQKKLDSFSGIKYTTIQSPRFALQEVAQKYLQAHYDAN